MQAESLNNLSMPILVTNIDPAFLKWQSLYTEAENLIAEVNYTFQSNVTMSVENGYFMLQRLISFAHSLLADYPQFTMHSSIIHRITVAQVELCTASIFDTWATAHLEKMNKIVSERRGQFYQN